METTFVKRLNTSKGSVRLESKFLKLSCNMGWRAPSKKLMMGLPTILILKLQQWPAPGFEDTDLGVLMEPEVSHGTTEVYARIQA